MHNKDEAFMAGMPEDDRRMFQEASQRHNIFVETTKQKRFGTDMKDVQENVSIVENYYLQLLNSYPEWDALVYQLATLYLQTNRNGLCIRLLKPMVGRKSGVLLEWVNNLGAAYRNEHMNAEAAVCFKQALKLDRQTDILANLCALWVNEGYPERGIPYGREALAKEPKHKQATWNLGLLLMENGEWEEGFSYYRQGFETGERLIRPYLNPEGKEAPFWKGEDLNGKTIVLHGEQGIGDELLFLQFIYPLCEQYPDARIILDVHPRLCSAIQRSMGSIGQIIDFYPTRKEVPVWNTSQSVDFKDGLGSLPAYYWESMSKYAGWLKPKEDLVQYYKNILLQVQKENCQEGWPLVGISWEGGKKKTRNDLRSIGLEEWGPILSKDCTFVSLQYTPSATKEASKVFTETGVRVLHYPDVTERKDYEHTLALVTAMDLVVTVNTSIVHACGSMGHPCWTLTPHGHAWRYGKKEVQLPFYKSVTQFHQNPEESWKRVINKVGFQVMHFAEEFRPATDKETV